MATSEWRDERQQIATIARATFGGFLQSDLMPAGMQAQAAIWAAAFLAAPALLPCAQLLVKYSFIRKFHPELLEATFWNDKGFFILMSCGAIGIVSIVMWDTLFPARRDVFVLGPLPLAARVQSAGRLGGLLTLFVLFAAALNVLPAILFPLAATDGFVSMFRGVAAHVTATLAADSFVFFGLTALQGTLLVFTTRRIAERIAPIIQTGAVVVLLLTLLFLMPIRQATAAALVRNDITDPVLRWFPLAWFVGLSELIGGTSRPIMTPLALRGFLAGALPLLATVALYAFAFRRLCARAIETPVRSSAWTISKWVAAVIRTILVRHPAEQAICAFTLRVLARSRRHRMLLSIYVGAALALIATALLPDILGGHAEPSAEPTASILAAPLILSAGLGVGFRALLAIPVDLPARWVFQMISTSPLRVGGGVHKAGLLVVVLPVVAVAYCSTAALWGPSLAARHALFCAALSTLLLELLLVTYDGVPFARVYVPGGSRFHVLWPIYISCFITYTYTAANMERGLLMDPALKGTVIFFFVVAAILASVRLWRLSRLSVVPFEVDLPGSTFTGFNLSEGLAAQAVARHDNAPS